MSLRDHKTPACEIGANLVFDAVGKSSFGARERLFTKRGRYTRPHGQNVYLPLLTRLRPGPRVDFPVPSGSKESILEMTALLDTGKFNPLIDTHFSLSEVRDAYEYVLTGQKLGDVILDIAEASTLDASGGRQST